MQLLHVFIYIINKIKTKQDKTHKTKLVIHKCVKTYASLNKGQKKYGSFEPYFQRKLIRLSIKKSTYN
jgi:protein-arginine kinase activator protein McsA